MSNLVSLLDRAAMLSGDHRGLTCSDRRSSWLEVRARVSRIAGHLRDAGIRDGERVAILANNSDRYFEAMLAIAWAGGVYQPMNTRLAPAELIDQISDAKTAMIIVDDLGIDLLGSKRDSLGVPIMHLSQWDAIALDAEPVPPSVRGADDIVGLYYTGGTTGRAKGVMLSHRNFIANAISHVAGRSITASETYLHAMPMFHVSASVALFSYLVVGSDQIFLERFDPSVWMTAVASGQVTRSGLAPTMLRMVLDHPDFDSALLTSLRQISYGGAPIPSNLLQRALAALPHIGFIQSYGQTETSGLATQLGPADHRRTGKLERRNMSAGRPIPGIELRILDCDGRELPIGETGEVCLRGDSVMLGYWNRAEESAAALKGGWLRTGDAGQVDEDGYVYIVDRLKDMIVTGGENVFSGEVEAALIAHPAIAECAVIGIPDPRWGEAVHAIVRGDPSVVSADALIRHCRERIAGFKTPKSIEFRVDPFPTNAAGKILKRELRAPYWSGSARSIN